MKRKGDELFIEVFERKEGEQEAENWEDNFEVNRKK